VWRLTRQPLSHQIEAAIGEGFTDRRRVHVGLIGQIADRAGHPQHPLASPRRELSGRQGPFPEIEGGGVQVNHLLQRSGRELGVAHSGGIALRHAPPCGPHPCRHHGGGFPCPAGVTAISRCRPGSKNGGQLPRLWTPHHHLQVDPIEQGPRKASPVAAPEPFAADAAVVGITEPAAGARDQLQETTGSGSDDEGGLRQGFD